MRRFNRILLLAACFVMAFLGLTTGETSASHGLLFLALAAGFFASERGSLAAVDEAR